MIHKETRGKIMLTTKARASQKGTIIRHPGVMGILRAQVQLGSIRLPMANISMILIEMHSGSLDLAPLL